MKFEEALLELRKGKKIVSIEFPRLEFNLSGLYELSYTVPSGISSFSVIETMIKGDWEVLESPGKTFSEVFEAFKEGKSIRRKLWTGGLYVINKENNNQVMPNDLLATDWEICE